MSMRRWSLVCLALVVAAGLLVVPAWVAAQEKSAAPARAFDRLVPDDVFLFGTVRDVAKSREALLASPLGKVWTSEEVQAFIKKPIDEMEKELLKMKGEPMTLAEWAEIFQGQVAFAMGRLDPGAIEDAEYGDTPPVEIVAMIDGREHGERLDKWVSQIEESASDTQTVAHEEFQEVDLLIIGRRAEPEDAKKTKGKYEEADEEEADEEADEESGEFILARVDTLLVLGNSRSLIEKVIAAQHGAPVKVLADNPLYTQVRDRLGKGVDAYGYMNFPQILAAVEEAAEARAEEEDEEVAEAVLGAVHGVEEALGAKAIQGIGLGFEIQPQAIVHRGFIAVAGEKKGLLAVLGGEGGPLEPPALVPDDAASYAAVRVDWARFWETTNTVIGKLTAMAGPMAGGPGAESRDPIKQIETQFKINVKSDIIDALGSEFYTFSAAPGKDASPMPAGIMTALIRLQDRAKLQGAIDKISAAQPGLFEKKTYLGRDLYVTKSAGMPEGADDPDSPSPVPPIPSSPTVAFAFTEEFLVAGFGSGDVEDSVQDVLRRMAKPGKPLSESAAYRKAAETLPAGRVYVQYADTAGTLEALWPVIKMSLSGGMGPGMRGPGRAAARENMARYIDPSLFPSAEIVTPYLGPATAAVTQESDGIAYVSTLLLVTPDETKAPEAGKAKSKKGGHRAKKGEKSDQGGAGDKDDDAPGATEGGK